MNNARNIRTNTVDLSKEQYKLIIKLSTLCLDNLLIVLQFISTEGGDDGFGTLSSL